VKHKKYASRIRNLVDSVEINNRRENVKYVLNGFKSATLHSQIDPDEAPQMIIFR
jgi:hypothetical protein